MPEQDKTGVPIYEPPPPKIVAATIAALVLNVAAVIAIVLEYCGAAAALIVGAILALAFLTAQFKRIGEKQPADNYEPPPP